MTTERPGKALVRDPAQAIAMAKCWLATWVRRAGASGLPPVGSFHPDKCGYCDTPRDLLIQMLEEFQGHFELSSYADEKELKFEIEAWETLPPGEQLARVRRAQGYFAPERGADKEDRRSPW